MSSAIDPRIAVDKEKPGSERSFGLVFAAVLTLIALMPLRHDDAPHWLALAAAIIFGAAGLARPQLLRPLNFMWFRLGQAMNRVVSPVVMGAIFFIGMTPIGVVLRLGGKDLLGLKPDRNATSYWIAREAAEPISQTMRNQF